MKILVPIKRVIDAYVTIQVRSDGSGVETQNVKMSMNPFCEIAVEEAVRLKEAGKATEIIAITAGSEQSQDILRSALAIGADRAIHIKHDGNLQPLGVAKLLKAVVDKESPDLVIMGKQAIDADNNQTGQMLAALLGWGQGTFVSKVDIDGGETTITREIDGGLQTLKLKLPAVLTTDLRLNEPRYPALPKMMQAKKKPIEALTADELGIDVAERFETVTVTEPPERQEGIKVGSVDELLDKLKNEAKAI